MTYGGAIADGGDDLCCLAFKVMSVQRTRDLIAIATFLALHPNRKML